MVRLEGNISLKNPVTPPGINLRTIRLVTQRLSHYATPGPIIIIIIIIIIINVGSCHRPFLPGTSLEPAVIPTALASSVTLQYFPYYV
jgi:uncharacterized integral membrane protein